MSQTPKSQPISRNLSSEICPSLYPSILHTSLHLFTAMLSISLVDFLSCYIFESGDARNCYVRSVSLVRRRNIPQIILPLNVPNSQSQTPLQLTFSVSKKRKAENSEKTTPQLRAQSIQYLGIRKWWVASSPRAEVILKPWLALQEHIYYNQGMDTSLTTHLLYNLF